MKFGGPFLALHKMRRKHSDKWEYSPNQKNLLHTNVAVGIWEKRIIEPPVHAIAFSYFDLQNPYKILIN